MDRPLISVIIPTFNSGSVIKRCLDAIVGQNSKNFEVIILDALSNDSTLEIVRGFGIEHDFIWYVSESDNGIYDAMNKGIKMAKGEWLLFLGSDDFLVTNSVMEDLGMMINAYPSAQVIYGDVLNVKLGRKTGGRYGGIFDERRILKTNICHQGIIYRKELFARKAYDTRFKYFADYEFNLRWMLNPTIEKKYVPLLVSNFSDGGLSSTVPGDPVFLKEYALIVKNLVKVYFQLYPNRISFLTTFFHRINKLDGPKTSLSICRKDFVSFKGYAYTALFIALTRYLVGFYFLKKRINNEN